MYITKKLIPAVAFAALFSGCQDEDFGYEAQDIKYEKEFKAAFGKIDPEQDFNLATRASVTVSTSVPSRIKIYAKHGNRFMLVGDYADVNGTQTLGVDVIEGTTELRVSNGSFAHETTVGGSVDFVGGGLTRGIVNTDISTKTTDYFEMSEALVKAWVPIIPERDEGKRPYWGTNLGKVTQDFTYVSQGKFTMYPMFSYTSASDQIGIYYTDQQGAYHEVIVMNNDFGDDLQFQFKNDPQDGRQTGVWYSCSGHQPAYGNGAGLKEVTNDGTHVLDNIAKVQGKGVIIDLPKGTEFGMFIIVNGGIKYYSESRFNGDAAVKDVRNESIEIGQNGAYTVTTDLTKKACHASSFYCSVEGKEYQFLGFEDWDNAANGGGMSDFDLNDFMVLFDGVLPSVNDQETPGWILAYEDLGNTFDWDFNDIVAKVQHVSGQAYATFTPLAAVGTLDSYVMYNGNYITGEKATSEIHAMLGATDEAPHAIINGYSKGTPGQSVTFSVPEEFSMTVLGDVSEMGGLTLEVETEEGTTTAEIAYNGEGGTPEVICLPEFWYDNDDAPRFRSEWAWPTEHSSIRYVYPGFATWVSDHTASTDWYKAEPQGERGTEGTVGDNTTGAAVGGAFITNINTGSIVDRVDPKAITVFKDPLYVALQSNTPLENIFSTVSNGALSYSSSNTNVCVVNNGAMYAGAVGEAILTIHQKMGTSGEGDNLKQWPNCDVDVHVIVLNANGMNLGTLDAYNNWSEANALALEAGQDYILYFKSTGGSNGGAYSSSATGEAVTVSDPEAPHNMSSNGSITIHASKVGTSEVTVKQARNDSYMAAEKTITVTVSAAATNLSLSQSSVSVGSNNASAYVAINTNNTESTPVVTITSGSDYFDAVYEDGKVKVTGKAVGNGTVKVSQAASDSYTAATDVELSVEVTAPQHDLNLTSATSITLAAADATSQITASTTTGIVQYEVVEGNSLIEVSAAGVISVKDGPGTAKVRVFVAANDEYRAAEKFVDVNVTWENNTLPAGAVDIKEYAKDDMSERLPGEKFTDGKTNGLVLVAVMSNDLPDKKNSWSDDKYQFYGANGNWVTAATTNNVVLQKGTNTFEITAAECATFEGTGMYMNFNGASQWVKKFYIMYK